jgi:hypothetical protein
MVGPIGGWPTAAQRSAQEDRLLQTARETFPDWTIVQVFGGWLAVPEGTPLVQSVDLEGVLEKLRSREA